jgi:hypothetical protein
VGCLLKEPMGLLEIPPRTAKDIEWWRYSDPAKDSLESPSKSPNQKKIRWTICVLCSAWARQQRNREDTVGERNPVYYESVCTCMRILLSKHVPEAMSKYIALTVSSFIKHHCLNCCIWFCKPFFRLDVETRARMIVFLFVQSFVGIHFIIIIRVIRHYRVPHSPILA